MLAAHALHKAFYLGIAALTHGVLAGFLDGLENLAGVLQIEEFPG